MAVIRPPVEKRVIDGALVQVIFSLQRRINEKGNGAFASSHEIYGVLAEEMKEFLDEVHANSGADAKIKELEDIAVGAIFGIASLRSGADW